MRITPTAPPTWRGFCLIGYVGGNGISTRAAYREHVVDEFCTRTAALQWPAGPKRSAGFSLRTAPGAEADGSAGGAVAGGDPRPVNRRGRQADFTTDRCERGVEILHSPVAPMQRRAAVSFTKSAHSSLVDRTYKDACLACRPTSALFPARESPLLGGFFCASGHNYLVVLVE